MVTAARDPLGVEGLAGGAAAVFYGEALLATGVRVRHRDERQSTQGSRHAETPRLGAMPGRNPARVARGATAASVLTVAGALGRPAPVEALGASAKIGGTGSALHLPAAYMIFSPICEGYDALTLLTLSQHAAVLGWLVAVFAAFRVLKRRALGARAVRRRPMLTEAMLFGGVILGFAAVYVAGAVLPRPMAALTLDDPNEIAVDVHSHTSASHDGRPGFDAEANRRWHAAAGFGAAYVTDHRYFAGAVAGAGANPARAGDGTVLLSGIESVAPHSRVTILGARAEMALDENGTVNAARLARAPGVVIVLTTPASLASIPATMRLDAVEISDGAPRGLVFTRRLAPEIERFAMLRHLAPVAGSNNHGWGRTASAWTILRIPAWRAMSPDSLDGAIRRALLRGGDWVRVIARSSTPLPRSVGAVIATPALIVWGVITRLTAVERFSWLAWIWSLAAVALLIGRRRTGDDSDDDPLPFPAQLPNGDARGDQPAVRHPHRGRPAAR